jgi:hypothetical protein
MTQHVLWSSVLGAARRVRQTGELSPIESLKQQADSPTAARLS